MDIILSIVMVIVGAIFASSAFFEFKLLCVTDFIGGGVGIVMMIIGAFGLYGTL